jgi:hypothetical protein
VPPDYQRQVVIYGDYEGQKLPLMLDSDGRVVYLSSDWKTYTATLEGVGAVLTTLTATGRYKRMGLIVFFDITAYLQGDTGSLTNFTMTLPVTPANHGDIVFPCWLRSPIKPPDDGWSDYDRILHCDTESTNYLTLRQGTTINLATHYGIVKTNGFYGVG